MRITDIRMAKLSGGLLNIQIATASIVLYVFYKETTIRDHVFIDNGNKLKKSVQSSLITATDYSSSWGIPRFSQASCEIQSL